MPVLVRDYETRGVLNLKLVGAWQYATHPSLALPGKLEIVAKALGLKHEKDSDGHKNMLDMSKPRKRREGEPPGVYWHDDPARFKRLYAYCIRDGEVEQELQKRIGFLPPTEQAVWELDAAINDRGVYLDIDLAHGATKIDEAAHGALDAELAKITCGAVTSVNQTQKLIDWLTAHNCTVDNIQKAGSRAHTEEYLGRGAARHGTAPRWRARRRRQIHERDGWRNADGRVRGCFEYHGCSTGRWSSHGIQLQNMKKAPVEGVPASAIDAIKSGDIARLRALYPEDPLSIVGEVVRAVLCASPGHVFMDADFSGIESRVTAWLAGEQSKLDQWAKFDAPDSKPEDEPYYIVGVSFNLPQDQLRAKGKVGDLAFGFAGGKGAYRALAKDDPATDAEVDRYKDAWRRAHPKTVNFWADIWSKAIDAVMHPGKAFEVNSLISWRCDDDSAFLRMRLPSGRELAYPFQVPSQFVLELILTRSLA